MQKSFDDPSNQEPLRNVFDFLRKLENDVLSLPLPIQEAARLAVIGTLCEAYGRRSLQLGTIPFLGNTALDGFCKSLNHVDLPQIDDTNIIGSRMWVAPFIIARISSHVTSEQFAKVYSGKQSLIVISR